MKYSANISTLWRDIPLRERLDKASNARFHAVEFLFVAPFGLQALIAGKEEFGLEIALFDLDIGDPTFRTGYGYLCRPEGEQQFLDSVDEALDAATFLGCHRINALVGRETPGVPWERQRDLVVERLRRVAPVAAEVGVVLLVEAISTHLLPGYLVNYSRQALEIVDLVGHPNVRFQYDVYHMQLMEGNLISTLRANVAKIAHVQIADVPGRHEPGTGEINYPNVLKALEETGYRGYVGLEYVPLGPDPFAWMGTLQP
jgi:hydroxypyruvate isomerase